MSSERPRIPEPAGDLLLGVPLANHFQEQDPCKEIGHMDLNLSQFGTNGSRWDQKGLPPIAHWSHPRWGFLLLVLAGNVVVAILAWIIVGLVTR
jgi:hypothetical protein